MFKDKRRRIKKPLRKNKYNQNDNLPPLGRKPQRLMAYIKSPSWKQKLGEGATALVSNVKYFSRNLPTFGEIKSFAQRSWTLLQNNLPIAGGALLLCIAAWTASSLFDQDSDGTILIEQALYPDAKGHLYEDIPVGSNIIQRTPPKRSTTQATPPKAKPGFTVLAIDAGHGGVDPGSLGKNGLTEKEITLDLAKRVRAKLSSVDKLHVALTRYDDSTLNIDSRTELINNIGANFVLSLHLNAIPQEHISLVESYYKTTRRADPSRDDHYIKSSNSKVKASHSLAKSVQSRVFKTVEKHNDVSINAGLKTSPMRILSQNSVPGVLIEITCLSNPDEEQRLRTEAYLDELATGIADGIKEFLQGNSESLTASL